MDILHNEVLDKGPDFSEFPPFHKILPRGKFKKTPVFSPVSLLNSVKEQAFGVL